MKKELTFGEVAQLFKKLEEEHPGAEKIKLIAYAYEAGYKAGRKGGLSMVDNEEYSYFKRELMKRKTKPYFMSNRELAEELFNRFKLEAPDASIHFRGISQFICMDSRARRNLSKRLKEDIKKREQEIQELKDLIAEVERG